jgi:hypothetical protein
MEQLANAFRQSDPLDALDEYIAVFSRFWQSDRLVTRRLRAMSTLDPDFEQVVKARDEWRRQGLHVIVLRIIERYGKPTPEAINEIVNILFTLLSFETFDTLAGSTQSIEEVSPLIQRLARAALGPNDG